MAERRYNETEVGEIFDRATRWSEAPSAPLAPADGLTLHQLQEIGREVGIAPEQVSAAAASLDHEAGVRRIFGLPLGVSHTVVLPREPSDQEWARLLADLRATFGAAGRVREDGGLRGWTNGNLHAYVEPTGAGFRLRMGTTKESASQLMTTGFALLGLAVILLASALFLGDSGLPRAATILAAMGAGTIAWGALPLPSWAARRIDQMEEIANRQLAAMGSPPGE